MIATFPFLTALPLRITKHYAKDSIIMRPWRSSASGFRHIRHWQLCMMQELAKHGLPDDSMVFAICLKLLQTADRGQSEKADQLEQASKVIALQQ